MKKSPIELFFSLGEFATKNDPKRKADFDYYLMLMMFIAFAIVFLDNWIRFFFYKGSFTNFGWGLVMVAILWFQYYSLKGMYEFRKMIKSKPVGPEPEIKLESEEEMLKEFENAK